MLDTSRNREYDLAIIGGGINGVAIARDAALRGLSVILLEQNDFGSGASSKTSKLAHGGLRYLEQYQFRLVKECLHERDLLIKNASSHVKLLPFVLPFYIENKHPFWMLNLGLHIYDFLDRGGEAPKHHTLTTQKIREQFPQLKTEGLKDGFLYYDGLTQDSRLVIANMLSAEKNGAHILNHATVTELLKENGIIHGLTFRNEVDGSIETIRTNAVVNASGAWSNQILNLDAHPHAYQLKPWKGVHLVIPKVHDTHAMILSTPQDQRVFFLIPWNGNTLIGTTDTFYDGDPNALSVSPEDESYLLTALNHYFPELHVTKSDVIASFAGLRPLVTFHKDSPSRIKRDFLIDASPSGLVTVLGGKYTTHRLMAEKVVDRIFDLLRRPQVPCKTSEIPIDVSCDEIKAPKSLSVEQITRLKTLYGRDVEHIYQLIEADPKAAQQICPLHPHLLAELQHAILKEKAATLEDWFYRRTSIAYTPCKGQKCLETTAQQFAEWLNWDNQTLQQALSHWKNN